jgi:hypothetical protein
MSEEKNPLNVYNHIETIREALNQIETIHVYELANRQYGTSEEEELRIRVTELDALNKDLNKQWASMFENYNKLADEHTSALTQVEKLTELLGNVDGLVVREVNYVLNKLPRFIKKWYGLE